jgi:hypothetical protein
VAAAIPQCHNHPDLGMVFIGGLKLGQFLFPSDGTHPSGLFRVSTAGLSSQAMGPLDKQPHPEADPKWENEMLPCEFLWR